MATDSPIVFPRLPLKTAKDMPEECCEKCRFLHLMEAVGPGGQKFDVPLCRRYPPAMCLVMTAAPLPAGMIAKRGEPVPMQPQTMPLFPQIAFDSWCGEFSPDLKKPE